MHYSDNKTLQQAFNAGVAFALGRNQVLMAYDDAKWITVHPNGETKKGRPALIDSATGEVLGGMGGKFTGRHISAVKQGGKFEQMGAQMNVNRVNHKPEMMNNQQIGFYDVENEQEKTTSQYNAQQAKARLNTEEIIKNDAIKQAVLENDGSLLETYLEDLDNGQPFVSKVVTPKNVYTFKDGKWVDSKGSDKLGSISNRVLLDFEEFKKSSDYASNETTKRAENDTLVSQGRNLDPKLAQKLDKKQEQISKLSNELEASSGRTLTQQRGDSTRRAKLDKLQKEANELKEQLRDKATKSENNQPAENTLNAMTEQEYLNSKGVGGAFSDYMLDKLRSNPNITERAKKRANKEADKARNDYFDKREQARKEYQEKISNGELRNKTPLEERLKKAQGHEDNDSVQSARRLLEKQGIDWRTGQALNAKGEETLRKNAEKIASLSKPQSQTNSAPISNAVSSGPVASVLNVPDASKWNKKIYKYRNGDRAVFINNEKIVLTPEQYDSLKKLAK